MSGCVVSGFRAEDGYALSTEAGWNQTVEDWERLLRLAPEGCFGILDGGRLVASAVAFPYGRRLAWIGMVLTTASHRGKGYARTLMQHCLDYLDAAGVESVKLDATDLGRPVYAKLGFVDERPVSRWLRKPAALEDVAGEFQGFDDALALADFDAFGADRTALLREFAKHEVLSLPRQALLFTRPGRTARHLGPCVARDADAARSILTHAVALHQQTPILWDIFDENERACALARSLGFEPVRHLIRMYRGPQSAAARGWHPDIYALAAFEYG
jgi:GNAT superfamily N-acetyltransferase